MVEIPATHVAQMWIEAVTEGDARRAWTLMDPDLRLALVQDWLDWAGPDLLALRVRGRDAVTDDLASTRPRLGEFEALTSRLFAHWDEARRELRPCVALEGGEIADGVREVVFAAVAGDARKVAYMRRTEDGWRVASFGGYALPTPGSPPKLAGTIGAGQAPVGRYV